MARLDGKVAIVTGAAQGIGAVLATALAHEGAQVVVSDVADTAHTVDAIKGAGGAAIGLRCDVTDNADIKAMVEAAESAFGPVEILVNNAGLFTALRAKPFMQMTEEEWDRVMTVNARGTFQVTKGVVPSMQKAKRGKIVNISSGTFFYGAPGLMSYVASKAAIIGMTRCMARELGDHHITVNAIAPGLTESEGVKNHPDFMKGKQPMAVDLSHTPHTPHFPPHFPRARPRSPPCCSSPA